MATAPELVINITVAEIARLDVRPGDKVVLHVEDVLTNEIRGLLREQLKRFFPDNEVLIVSNGMRLGLLREGADEPVYLDTPEAG